MTISEAALLFIAGIVATVVAWGVKSLVRTNQDNSTSIAGINTSLATMNGRLLTTERLSEQHHLEDREKFRINEEDHKEMWHEINHR